MASTTKVDQLARAKARERRIALDRDRKARDERIEDGAARVFAGVTARQAAQEQVSVAEATMAAGLNVLAREGLTTSQLAELCELTVGEVQRLTKRQRLGRSSRSSTAAARAETTGTRPAPASRAVPVESSGA